MRVINPGFDILTPIKGDELKKIELAGRTCYKSEDRISDDSAKDFVKMLIDRGHEAMLEHSSLSVKFICDRGVSHEIVRHRIASFAQESTRYCNYSKEKFGSELTFIKPCFFEGTAYDLWSAAMLNSETIYFGLLSQGATPQQARSVLPNSLKTEIVVTANYREWRNILKLRTAKAAHPQMREIMIPLLNELKTRIPVIFDDIIVEE